MIYPTHICPSCGSKFNIKSLIHDPSISLLGLSFVGDDTDMVYYFFQHETSQCSGSFTVRASEFRTEFDERIPDANLAGTDTCGLHCTCVDDHLPCINRCIFAPYREFLDKMLEWKGMIRKVAHTQEAASAARS